MSNTQYRRNLFEVENARNLSVEEVANTFIATNAFFRLLSPKNHIVLGARGSGKTVLARMISHDHLSLSGHEKAQEIIQARSFIGTYTPMKLEWVSALRNKPWQTQSEKEEFFQWRLNVATSLSFITTVRSCLVSYVPEKGQRIRMEEEISRSLGHYWLGDDCSKISNLSSLERRIRLIEYQRHQEIAKNRNRYLVTGVHKPAETGHQFDVELFAPMRLGMMLLSEHFDLNDRTTWLLCLDEAEFLDEDHHRILNSYLRSHSGNLFFKITTMPYQHHTQETNTAAKLDVGDDFEYIYIDQDPVSDVEEEPLSLLEKDQGRWSFAQQIYNKRAESSGSKFYKIPLHQALGESYLLDPAYGDWSVGGELRILIERYLDEKSLARAFKLLNKADSEKDPEKSKEYHTAFKDQMGRKIKGSLLLKDALLQLKGAKKLDAYAGWSMIVRCADGNPRRLVRLFNSLFTSGVIKSKKKDGVRITKIAQNKILEKYSKSQLERIRAEKDIGPEIYDFISAIGTGLSKLIHEQKLTSDQYGSINISESDFNRYREYIERAVGLGLLYPNMQQERQDELPEHEGTFRLAYVLAHVFICFLEKAKAKDFLHCLETTSLENNRIFSLMRMSNANNK